MRPSVMRPSKSFASASSSGMAVSMMRAGRPLLAEGGAQFVEQAALMLRRLQPLAQALLARSAGGDGVQLLLNDGPALVQLPAPPPAWTRRRGRAVPVPVARLLPGRFDFAAADLLELVFVPFCHGGAHGIEPGRCIRADLAARFRQADAGKFQHGMPALVFGVGLQLRSCIGVRSRDRSRCLARWRSNCAS